MAMIIQRSVPLLILALIWETVTRSGIVDTSTLPTLSSVAEAFWQMLQGDMLYHIGQSLKRGAMGFGLAVLIGPIIGIFIARFRVLRNYLNPLLQLLYPIPKSALLPLLIIWMGLYDATKVTLIFIGCLLPIIITSYNAALGVPKILIWSARSFGASQFSIIWEVVLPSSLPDILTAMRTSLAIGFILLVTSEFIIANNGIGYVISAAGGIGDNPVMFAAIIAISAIGFLADRIFDRIARRLLVWREESHG